MPKVSQFPTLDFPTPSSQFTLVGEKKCLHGPVSRVLWQGGYVVGSNQQFFPPPAGMWPVLDFLSSTQNGTKVLAAGFFNTYRALIFNAFVDISGMTTAGNFLRWGLATSDVAATTFYEEIPFALDAQVAVDGDMTLEVELRLIRVNDTMTSTLRLTACQDNDYARVYQFQYGNHQFDGSEDGVDPGVVLYPEIKLLYGAPPLETLPEQPKCLFSRISF